MTSLLFCFANGPLTPLSACLPCLQIDVTAVRVQAGAIIVATESQKGTWDVIWNDYGTDVEQLDGALDSIFSRYTIDPDKIAVGGFSDGATYALSLGLTNGDLFRHIIAFSPGFMRPGEAVGPSDLLQSMIHQMSPEESCGRMKHALHGCKVL